MSKSAKRVYRLKLAVGGYAALTYCELCQTLGFSEGAGILITNKNTISFQEMNSFDDIVKLYNEVIKHGFVPAIALKKYAYTCVAAGIGQIEEEA